MSFIQARTNARSVGAILGHTLDSDSRLTPNVTIEYVRVVSTGISPVVKQSVRLQGATSVSGSENGGRRHSKI